MARVIIGMDPHKRSATIEIINGREKVLVSALMKFGSGARSVVGRLGVPRMRQ